MSALFCSETQHCQSLSRNDLDKVVFGSFSDDKSCSCSVLLKKSCKGHLGLVIPASVANLLLVQSRMTIPDGAASVSDLLKL
jgi:hypothetical protein